MPGGGDVKYFENYYFLVAVEGVRNILALPRPILKKEADRGLGQWMGRGCAFAPAVLFGVWGLREPSQDSLAEQEGGGISWRSRCLYFERCVTRC